jgi:hypothetical protein
MNENEQLPANIGFAKWRGQCFYDSLVQGSSSVFQMNNYAEINRFAKPVTANLRPTIKLEIKLNLCQF